MNSVPKEHLNDGTRSTTGVFRENVHRHCTLWRPFPSCTYTLRRSNLSHHITMSIIFPERERGPLNDLFSTTTWVSRHQEGQTNLDVNEARDDGMAVASAGPYANHLQTKKHTPAPHHLFLYTPDAFCDAKPTASKI